MAFAKCARKSASNRVQFVHGAVLSDRACIWGVAQICARPVSHPNAWRNLSLSVVTVAFVNHVLHWAIKSLAFTGFHPLYDVGTYSFITSELVVFAIGVTGGCAGGCLGGAAVGFFGAAGCLGGWACCIRKMTTTRLSTVSLPSACSSCSACRTWPFYGSNTVV